MPASSTATQSLPLTLPEDPERRRRLAYALAQLARLLADAPVPEPPAPPPASIAQEAPFVYQPQEGPGSFHFRIQWFIEAEEGVYSP